MKNLDIFYFGNVYAVNGINFVTDLLISGRTGFEEHEICLKNLYSSNGHINLTNISTLSIGKGSRGRTVGIKQFVRRTLSNVLSSKIGIFAWFKIKKSLINPAKQVVEDYGKLANEIVLFQDIFTAYFFLKKHKGSKSILILHCSKDPFEQLLGYYPSILGSSYHSKLKKIQDFVYNNIDRIVFLSSSAQSHNEHLLRSKSTYIYNGIPELNRQDTDKPFENSIINLVCVGSMNGHKGQDLLIRAVKEMGSDRLSQIHLHLIGGGAEFENLKALVRKLNLQEFVTMYGVRRNVHELLGGMDVMVLPSKSEGMPLAILEGMRQGMYILSTPVGAIPEMINENFGDYIERDIHTIANKLKFLIDNPRLIYNAKNASRQFYLNKFTQKEMIEKYSLLINDVYEGTR